MTTALHFPGLLSKMETNIEGYKSEFEFKHNLKFEKFNLRLTSLVKMITSNRARWRALR